ncbi:MAG: nuclear transport factor 2 family protein [Cyclobacteriaceae bacterium]
MKKLLIAALLLLAIEGFGQQNEAFTILQKQVEAFNAKNIDGLVANITDDFKWYYIGPDTLLLEVSGKENFRKSMESYFNSISKVKSEIAEFAIDNNRISFKEVVRYETSAGNAQSASSMGIYEMKNGLIYRAWYFF